jgi:hypothetical protein
VPWWGPFSALDLRAPVRAQRAHRRARQRRVGREEPLQRLLVAEAVVLEHGEGADEALDHPPVADELPGDLQDAVLTPPHRDELAFLDHLADAGHLHGQPLRDVGEGEPGVYECVGFGVDLGHRNKPAIPVRFPDT